MGRSRPNREAEWKKIIKNQNQIIFDQRETIDKLTNHLKMNNEVMSRMSALAKEVGQLRLGLQTDALNALLDYLFFSKHHFKSLSKRRLHNQGDERSPYQNYAR